MRKNIITACDSYKFAHWNMYPDGTEAVYSYFESRTGAKFNKTLFFGLQYYIKEYLEGVVITKEMIDKAERLALAHFGGLPREHARHRHQSFGFKFLPNRIKHRPQRLPLRVRQPGLAAQPLHVAVVLPILQLPRINDLLPFAEQESLTKARAR